MDSLLNKLKRINLMLQNCSTDIIIFNDICKLLNDILSSNILVATKSGKIIALALKEDKTQAMISKNKTNLYLNKALNYNLSLINETSLNLNILDISKSLDTYKDYNFLIIPIISCGTRYGTFLCYRKEHYIEEDIIIGEYITTVIGLEIMHSEKTENSKNHQRNLTVKLALSTLSYSELEAILCIFNELNSTEGIVISSKIADIAGITRSVIVNALRKLESAGIVESRSLGVKGTYIKVIDEILLEELNKLKR